MRFRRRLPGRDTSSGSAQGTTHGVNNIVTVGTISASKTSKNSSA